jgi:hypothetical protein
VTVAQLVRTASVGHMVAPKMRIAKRRMGGEGSGARVAVLGAVGFVFWAMLFGIIYRMLLYFKAAAGIGDVLALKLLGLVLLAFMSVLLLSNIITSLTSFFLSKDLELFAAAPIDQLRFYFARLIENTIHSSWMVVLVLVPVFSAYAVAYGGGPVYIGVALLALVFYVALPAVLGAALTLILVNVFPARRARDLLALLALFGAAGLVVLFRVLRPEQLARPEGFRDLVDFVAALQTPQSIWMPSEWAAEAMMSAPASARSTCFPCCCSAARLPHSSSWARRCTRACTATASAGRRRVPSCVKAMRAVRADCGSNAHSDPCRSPRAAWSPRTFAAFSATRRSGLSSSCSQCWSSSTSTT